MALTLAADLGVPTTLAPAIRLTITGTVPYAIEAGYLFRLEDEVLELKYFGKTQETILGGAAQQTVDDRNVWYAQRGVDTAIASHAATTAVKGVADALVSGATETQPAPPFPAAGGATDHGALDGLGDDDHTGVYATPTELTDGLALKATPAQVATAVSDHSADTTSVHGIADTAALAAAEVTVTSGASIAADTTDTSTTVLGPFLTAHVGWQVAGPGIPAGATIVSVVNGTSAVISAAATATASVTAQVSEPAPAGAGLWLRTGLAFGSEAIAGLFYRAAVEDDWRRVSIGDWDANGTLRAFVGLFGGTGFDILIFDADGNVRFQMESGVGADIGSFSLTGTSADGFTKKGVVAYDAETDTLNAAVNEVAGLNLSPTQVGMSLGADTLVINAAGTTIATAGNLTVTSLPTANPNVAGALWNDTGTVKVSAG